MSVTIPNYAWDFRQALSNGSTVTDQFSQETLTYDGPSSTVSDGVSITQESDHIDFGNTTVSIPPTFTIEMYYKTGSTQYIKGPAHTNTMARLNKPDYSDSFGLSLRIQDSGTYYINYPTNEGNNRDVNVIHEVAHNWTANTSYHFVLTFSTATSRLYVNNVLLSSETLSTPFNNGVTANHGGSYSAFGNKATTTWLPFSADIYFARIYHSELTANEIDTLYATRETNYFSFANMRINYGDVYLAQTLNKTLDDYKAENISLHDISFGVFPSANKYKQSYAKTLLDLSGEFVHRKHTLIGDISFNNDLSINNVMIVNNDLSFNKGLIVNGDASFNGNVNAIGDVSLNGNLKLKDKSIETSKLDFTIIENEGTFDTSQDVSLNSTFTIQGDFDKYLDNSGNIQTDFSENIVLIPSSLGLDLSGGSATLSGKTGDQAFLNGTYIVKDNSGNTTGNIYDDLHENNNNNTLTSLPKNWNSLQVNSRGNWVYDGSSNYTSYLDEYGRTQTVKGDNYDLTLPFHFYPSKAFLRTTPLLPASSSINPHNYPASVKFLGTSTLLEKPKSFTFDVPLPTHSYEFRVAETTSVSDLMGSGGTATYEGSATSNTTDGVIVNNPNRNEGNYVNLTPPTITDTTYSMEFYFTVVTDNTYHFFVDMVETASSSASEWTLATNSNGTQFWSNHFNDKFNMTNTTDPTAGTTYHAVISIQKNGTGNLYINNAVTSSVTSTEFTTSPLTVHAWEIGRRAINNDFYSDMKAYYIRYWDNHALTASEVEQLYNNRTDTNIFNTKLMNKYHLLGEFSNKATAITADSSLNYTYNSVVTNTSGNYLHGADFLYDLNRKYYINQLRMIVGQAPDSSGNSYGEYSIDRLAYSGSSFSGKKLENSYPNLYLNTAAHDISYGFTEDHTNIVYDLSHNKNQLPIIDMSGGGGIHIAPREISIQDGSLNTINIHKPVIKNTYSKPTYAENTYSSVAPATDASFNTEFYSQFGARDASGHFNKRISQDGKTIVTLQNRGYQAYDVSNAEVVFSTDYGNNWKNILRDCSDSFLFTEHDISYGLLFATGDVSGAIDIATSSNGQSMYVGRHRHFFKTETDYSGLGYVAAQEITIPSVVATNNHVDNSVADLRYFPQSFAGNNTGTGSITVSGLTGDTAAFNGSWSATMSSGITSTNTQRGLWGLMGTDTWTGQYGVNGYSIQYRGFTSGKPTISYNGGSVTAHYMLLEFPAYVKFSKWVHWLDDRFFSGSFIGTDENGVNQLLGTWSHSWNNGQVILNHSINGANNTYVNKLYLMFSESSLEWGNLHPMWFEGTYQVPGISGVPIPTTGVPEIYSTNYGNSWKLSPFKYHKGPTIISGDGSTILLLQESKLDNAKHAYATISGHGNNNPYVDTHWITTDYGSNWNTLNRSGYDISNNVIPPSYGSKTATFLKACMSYTGQYIYIYNVQCTTNNNYGELYYSHDYGNTWNKWTTVEAQNYVASGNTLAGSGQILCSGNGKYVFIAGQTASSIRLSQAIYYRSTDYGVTFNKDITTFPWQEGSSGEDSTSRGPFVSYEGDLIVISNTHYKYIDDSDATISYGSSQYSGLQYSLDYGVNYNVLELNEEPLSTVTNNFSNLPNQTNEFFSSLFSTKGDIFSNCPGPNDYSFLTSVMGGNTTDASFVFLQSIEFPKDKVSTTVEKEGPVITTYEEPIDTENDFGNITNSTSLTSGVSFYSSAISEDGQVLLSAGATDVSNGSYYGAYNLTNAKFPPTENVYDTIGNGIPQPLRDYNFLITGAASSTMSDNISGSEATYGSNVTSTTTNGIAINGNGDTSVDAVTVVAPEFSNSFCFETVLRFNANDNYSGLFKFGNGGSDDTIICDLYATSRKFRFYSYASSSILFASHSGGTHTGTTITTDGSTYHHMVFQYSAENEEAEYYQDGVRVWYQSNITYSSGYWPRTYTTNAIGDINNTTNFNMKYFRIWNNRALSSSEITTLYNNQTTVYLANSWTLPLPHFKTAQLSYNGNYAMAIPYGITQNTTQYLYYWSASGDFHRFDGNYMSNFDAENWKFGKLSGNGNFFVGFTHSSSTLSDASYNSATWWQDKVSNTMIIYKNLYTIPRGTVSDSDATTYGQGTTYDLNTAFSTDSGVTEYYITSVHVSETGQYVLFVGGSSDTTLTNRCAFSKDYGATFTNITSLFSFTDITKPLVYCHVSDNGRYLFISQYNSSEYCFSTDYGASFTLHNTFPSSTKTYGVVSKDGQNALFVDTNNYVYVSVNGNFRQEVIPSLSGTNTNLSLNHNYWKYKSTTGEITYNPSMPNIKYLVGIANNIIETSGSITAPTHSYDFRTAQSVSVSDQMGTGGTATYQGSAVSTTTDGVVIDNTDNSNGPKYVSITPPTISDSTHSIEIYFKLTTDIASYAMITSLKSDSEGEKWISTTGSAGNQFQNNNAQTGIDTTKNDTDPTTGTLYHAVVSATKNGNVIFYINNAATGNDSTGTVTTFSYTPTAWELGRRAIYGSNYADITVYYVRWWDGHALSSSEVSYLYTNRADSTFISQTVLASSNVRYTESYFSELDIKGSLTNLSGTAYTSSDYRVKENVRDLEDSDTIASLTPISYTQNNLHHKKSIGFLAHEFANSFPDLVDGTKDGPEMQSINYNGIIAVLIKEIQTLRAKINKLKSEI